MENSIQDSQIGTYGHRWRTRREKKRRREAGTTRREEGRWGGAWVPFAFGGRASPPEPFYANFGVKLADGFFTFSLFFLFFSGFEICPKKSLWSKKKRAGGGIRMNVHRWICKCYYLGGYSDYWSRKYFGLTIDGGDHLMSLKRVGSARQWQS